MDMQRRGFVLAATGLVVGLSATARADVMADLKAGKSKLRVGTDATFPPFEQTSAAGEKSGFDIDLVSAAAKHAGIAEVEFQQVPFGQLVPGLLANHIDLAASAIYITPERAKVVDFSAPYFTGGLCVMLRPDDASVTKPADLDGKTIAVQVGTKSVNFLQQNFPNAALHIAQTNDQMFQSLQSKQADVVVTGLPAAKYYIKVHGGAKVADFTLTHEQYGLAMRKTDPDLLAAINDALAAFAADGSLKALETKWFG
jgi:polar amino acid transport system substrate-binding protein/arginine/lysine/histidine/glutamine transport system substrate-binding/permease protein